MRLSAAALLIPAALAITTPAASARQVALSGPQEIAFLNAQRAANGIPADVVENPTLTANCALHMQYIANHGGVLTHEEDPAQPDYTAEGNSAGGSSVLTSAGSSFAADGTNNFETAPIHLMQMLSPWLVSSGASGGCLNTLADHSRTFATGTTFSYPGDGSTSVPTSETAYEGPFVPGDFVGLPMGTKTGPHLFFFYGGPAASTFTPAYFDGKGHFTASSLTGPSGLVDIRTIDDDTTGPLGAIGNYLPPGGIIIPVAPLAANKQYTASVTFQPDADRDGNGQPDLPAVTRTWSFSAGVVPPTPVVATPAPTTPKSPPPLPVKPILTKFQLKARSVAVTSTTSASLWVTVEAHVPKKPHSKTLIWKLRRSVPLPTTAGVRARVVLSKLAKGRYRVKIHSGTASGAVLLTSTTTLK